MAKTLAVAIVLIAFAAAASAWCSGNGRYEANMVLSNLKGRGCYNTFLNLANISGLAHELPGLIAKHKLTLLVPQDSAFAALPSSTVSMLLNKPKLLKQILYLHMERGLWNANGLIAKPVNYQFTALSCYMSAKVDKKACGQDNLNIYCAFGGMGANSDPLAKDIYYDNCVSVQGLNDVIYPGTSFFQTCNYPGM